MIHDGTQALVVDPGEAAPVLRVLQEHRLKLTTILVTHRHADHVGGLHDLESVLTGPVYGPASLTPHGVDQVVHDGDAIPFLNLVFQVFETPGHTQEHLSYFCDTSATENNLTPILFCGDTLFSVGCGRFFDGHPEWMLNTLNRLARLPDQTKICSAHEYTLSNLAFAKAVEPGNSAREDYESLCHERRSRQEPTLPTTLSIERKVNPFLRLNEPEIIASVKQQGYSVTDPLSVLTALRAWKNAF